MLFHRPFSCLKSYFVGIFVKVKLQSCRTNQLSVIAFINPDESFWYFDKEENDDLKANIFGAMAYSTLGNIIFSYQ